MFSKNHQHPHILQDIGCFSSNFKKLQTISPSQSFSW